MLNSIDIYYKIEYGKFDYNEEFHESSEEKRLDKLLGFFENIAKLYIMKNITLDDLRYFAYEFLVIYQDNSVKQYIRFLEQWFSRRGIKIKPYEAFQKVGKILEKEVYNHESYFA